MTVARSGPAPLDPSAFARLRHLVHETSGIVLGDHRTGMLRSRLARRMAATGCTDLSAYLEHLGGPGGEEERMQLVSALTVNVTHFFREAHHFELLRDTVIPARSLGQPLRIWSAGCSTGEEAWSIAMTLAAAGLGVGEAGVLGTDINRGVLARAAAGCYRTSELRPVPALLRRRFVTPVPGGGQIVRTLQARVAFRPLNLIADWPFRALFDAIFCRNVAIYFDTATQARLWTRLLGVLRPGGWLFLGHSERLPESLLAQVRYLGRTAYVKRPALPVQA